MSRKSTSGGATKYRQKIIYTPGHRPIFDCTSCGNHSSYQHVHLAKMLKIKIFSVVIAMHFISSCTRATVIPPKIAVVGAGIGGTSVSYFLRDLFGEGNVIIDVFEAREVGGRLATVGVGGQKYESGGAIIHPDNMYMAHFVKKFGLQKKGDSSASSKFAFHDGKDVVFSGSDWEIVTYLKMLWRYGWNPIKLNNHVEKMLHDFKRIYMLQDKGTSFLAVEDLLRAMNPSFVEDVLVSSEKGFSNMGISKRTINELVMAGLIVNYGQTTAAHKFVGSVSSATGNGHLWAIAGGNKQVPEMLLKYSGANLIKAKVKTISFMEDAGKYSLSYAPSGDIPAEFDEISKEFKTENDSVIDRYDIVIIAAPLTSDTSDIAFKNFPSSLDISGGKYHRTVCTLVKGEVNNTYFGVDDGTYEIFSIKGNLKVNSVSQVSGVWQRTKSEDVKVWKVFSVNPLTDKDLREIFTELEDVKVVDWLAYPHYDSKQKLGRFVLHENLFHINAIEWAASAMEMSAIGAKNVGLLAYKSWTGGDHFLKPRDEL